jgi:DNA-binding Lrp family transcriptional regulator
MHVTAGLELLGRRGIVQISLGRVSNVRLAQGVGLSPSACLRRIKIMERAGVSRGYTAFVDTSNAEASIAVIINITLERQTEDHLDRFEASVRNIRRFANAS